MMDKKGVIGIGLLLMVLVILGGILYNIFFVEKDLIEDKKNDSTIMEYDTLNLEYNYKDDNTWEYKVTGTLPNPCYTISTEAIVMESYPEQVIIRSTVTPPTDDVICIQIIQEIYQEGEFEASEQATVEFDVK
jgi:hypothetical protein